MYTPYKMMGSTLYGKPMAKKMLTAAQKTLPTELKEKMIESGKYEGPINKKHYNTMAKMAHKAPTTKKGCKSKYRK
jgi:hypothetical protein